MALILPKTGGFKRRLASRQGALWRHVVGCYAPCIISPSSGTDGVKDLSGYNAHGTFGTTTAAPTIVNSPLGLALQFSAASFQTVAVNANASRHWASLRGVSVFSFYKLTANNMATTLVSRTQPPGDVQGWGFGIADSITNRPKWYTCSNGAGSNELVAATTLNLNQWYSVCATYKYASSGTTKYIYIDGKVDASVAWNQLVAYGAGDLSGIGYWGGGTAQYTNIATPLILIFNRALQPFEVRALSADPLMLFRKPRLYIGFAPGIEIEVPTINIDFVIPEPDTLEPLFADATTVSIEVLPQATTIDQGPTEITASTVNINFSTFSPSWEITFGITFLEIEVMRQTLVNPLVIVPDVANIIITPLDTSKDVTTVITNIDISVLAPTIESSLISSFLNIEFNIYEPVFFATGFFFCVDAGLVEEEMRIDAGLVLDGIVQSGKINCGE